MASATRFRPRVRPPRPAPGAGRPAPAWLRALPNALTVLRLGLAAAFPCVPPAAWLPVALAAGASDALDGWIARRFGVTSRSGALLDGLADKALVLSVLATLVGHARVAWWQAALVLQRDLVVAFTFGAALLHRELDAVAHVAARRAGKLTTLLLFGWFAGLLLPAPRPVTDACWLAAAACSAWAAVDYALCSARIVRAHRARLSAAGRPDRACAPTSPPRAGRSPPG